MIDLGFDLKPVKGLVISGQGAFKGWESKSRGYTALQDNVKEFLKQVLKSLEPVCIQMK